MKKKQLFSKKKRIEIINKQTNSWNKMRERESEGDREENKFIYN